MKESCFTFPISDSEFYMKLNWAVGFGDERNTWASDAKLWNHHDKLTIDDKPWPWKNKPWVHAHLRPRNYHSKLNLYLAKYYGIDDLQVFRILNKESLAGPIAPQVQDLRLGKPEKKPWEIFYKFSWLEDLAFESRDISPAFGEKELLELHNNGYDWILGNKEHGILFLETLRDYPHTLQDPWIRRFFIKVLRAAKYDVAITEALHNYFIPKSPGGRISIPDNIQLAEALMVKLARHLKNICVIDSGILVKPHVILGRNRELDNATYKKLIKWASDNHEHRIKYLSNESLSSLLYAPKSYNNNLLLRYLKASKDTYARRKKFA